MEKNGILFCRSRIMDWQRFIITGGLDEDILGNEVQLNMMTPMLDRHSPIAYSIASFIHNQVGKHNGYETCYIYQVWGFVISSKEQAYSEIFQKNVQNAR